MNKIECGTSTIFQGNSLQILPTFLSESVDALITDPPYCSGAAGLSGKQAAPSSKYQQTGTKTTYPVMLGDCRDQRSFTLWLTMWLSECWRIAKPGAPALVFTDWRQLPCVVDAVQAAGFGYRGIVVWHKRSARPMLGEFRRDSEFIVYGCKPPFTRISRKCLPGVFNIPIITHQKIHLTSKPVALLEALMDIVPEGGTVLDPFLGGGTTAVAAQNTGRRCIGVELSEEYARIAAERMGEFKQTSYQNGTVIVYTVPFCALICAKLTAALQHTGHFWLRRCFVWGERGECSRFMRRSLLGSNRVANAEKPLQVLYL